MAAALVAAMTASMLVAVGPSAAEPRDSRGGDNAAPVVPDVKRAELSVAEQQAAALARQSGQRVLVDALTTEQTQVWALPTGGFTARVAAGVERFKRAGTWVEVDHTLVVRPDGRIAPKAHPRDLVIAGASGAAGTRELASITTPAGRAAFDWTGPLPAPVLDGPRATYPEVRPGVDLVLESTSEGVEQFFVVKHRAAVAHVGELAVMTRADGAVEQRAEPDGGVSLRNAKGAVIARVPQPVMWDSSDDAKAPGRPARTRRVPVTLDKPGAGQRGNLALRPDTTWILDPATVFPVVIDPALNGVASTFSTSVVEGGTTDMSAQGDLWFGQMGGSNPRIARAFVQWPADAFAGKQIVSASANFWNFWSATCQARPWQVWTTTAASTASRWTDQPTWLDADPSVPGDQPEAVSTATTGFDATCADGWISIDARGFFQRAATAGQTVAHMGLRAQDETDASGWKQVRSRNWTSNTTHRPYVNVTYNAYPTVTTRSTTPATSCVTGDSRPALQTLTPALSATVADGEGSPMTVTFEWRTVGAAQPAGTAVKTSIASGASASHTFAAGDLVEGGRYSWRVLVSDGTVTTATPACEFSVYLTAPPVPGCENGVAGDVNGDGIRDVTITDPRMSVNGDSNAGALYVVDGATGTMTLIHQDLPEVPGDALPGNRFGQSLAVYDANRDGCADVAVGVPYQDVAGATDAGEVQILFGSPAGLGKGPAALTYTQGANGVPGTPGAFDWFGYALTAGQTAAGEPFLVVGAPGEDAGGQTDAGIVHYFRGTQKLAFDQTQVGAGTSQRDDRFGFALASTGTHFAVTRPGQAFAAGTAFAGSACAFVHPTGTSLPTSVGCVDKSTTGVPGEPQAGDMFGVSVAMAPYWPAGDSILVVGAPGDDPGGVSDAGAVHQFRVTNTAVTHLATVSQDTAGISGAGEAGDLFGQDVVVVNTNPAAAPTAQTLLVAVGAPGEDLSGGDDAGEVRVFAAGTTTGLADTTVYRKTSSLPYSPTARELIGSALSASPDELFVASPYGRKGVYAIPWSALAAGTAVPTRSWAPAPNTATAFGVQVG
ncbi:DNRLRE domain-containing protein [Dactylosporangium sp. AC04546]|uniref:DNRLRE domain-containing protein n=1 Tax=Dactylosporangium sp. AC04546 TaxID=2862460 RepID=UPI001EDFAA34|nr:DNRLRE domain-containing protein [Dactylosporangium sp. AC04546]WVK79888.1 DNRLRE domain-containing protein [Dactylosporangium sp. AC04546]